MPKCVGDLINTRMGAVEFDMEAVEFGMGAAAFGRRNRAGPLKVVENHHQCFLLKWCRSKVQGDPSARGLVYVDISSVPQGCYPEMELMTT